MTGLRRHAQALATVALATLLLLLGWGQLIPAPWLSALGLQPSLMWHLIPLAVIATAMLVKHARPSAALLIGALAVLLDLWAGGSIGIFLCLTDLLYTYGLRARSAAVRRLALASGGVVMAAALSALIAGGAPVTALNVAVLGIAVLLTPLWWAIEVRRGFPLGEERRTREHLEGERHAALLRAQEEKRREALAQERRRMARELHDVVSSQVSAIALSSAARLSDEPDTDRDREVLQIVRTTSVEALEDLRQMVQLLRDPLRPVAAGGQDAGPGLAEDVPPKSWEEILVGQRALGLDIRVDGAPPADLDVPAGVALRWVLQEALTNARKHAGGSCIVSVSRRLGWCRLRVASDVRIAEGAGARDAAASGGGGLLGMAERIEAVGGRFSAGLRDRRWVVSAHVRLPSTSASASVSALTTTSFAREEG